MPLLLSGILSCNAVIFNPVAIKKFAGRSLRVEIQNGQGFGCAECPEVSKNLEVNLETAVIGNLLKTVQIII